MTASIPEVNQAKRNAHVMHLRAVKIKACDELKEAIEHPDMGEIVAKTERLILHYYHDVEEHATQSFEAAKKVAIMGLVVLVGSLLYVVAVDIPAHTNVAAWAQGRASV
jgi:hypothetical protein